MIKVNLSKSTPKHLVISCTREEAYEVRLLLYQQVLRPVGAGVPTIYFSKIPEQNIARFRLAQRHLEAIRLTFPMANISHRLNEQLNKIARKQYEELAIPDIKVPGLRKNVELLGHQKIAVDRIVGDYTDKGVDHFFLNDEMGLGKTAVALSVIQSLHPDTVYPCLCIVPNGIKYEAWLSDATKFFKGLDIAIIDTEKQSLAQRMNLIDEEHDITIVNPESLWRIDSFKLKEWAFCVVDEYHRYNNPTTRQTEGFLEINFVRGLFMSGTPIMNGRPEERWTMLHKAWPDKYPSYWAFKEEHTIKAHKGGKVIAYRNLGQLRAQVDPVELRRRKDHVLRDLPQKIYQRVTIKMSAEQRRIYDEILDNMLLELIDQDTGDTVKKPIISILAQITRLKQAAFSPELFGGSQHSAKLVELQDQVRALNENGEKAIIFSQWSRATNIIRRELEKYNPAYVTGKIKKVDRRAEIHRFQTDDDCQLFIGTMGACREGITLTAASYVIFTDKGWNPGAHDQAADRAHRIGQRRTVNVIDLFAQDTIEGPIEDLINGKRNVFNALIEKDGGVRRRSFDLEDIRKILEDHR